MKKYFKIAGWIVFVIAIIWIMVEVKSAQENQIMQFPTILVDTPEGMVFLKNEDLVRRLKMKGIQIKNIQKKKINTALIEEIVSKMPEVESVKTFTQLDGNWTIKLKIRRPIARIFTRKGKSFYLDDKGKIMPLSPIYTARVIPINGYISLNASELKHQKVINNDSLKSISRLLQAYKISLYVCDNPFLYALISQIYVKQNGDFVIIPRVGGQKIIFGKVKNDTIVKQRFDKLKTFYREAMPIVGWRTYDKINLKYKQQIVCTKK